MIEVSLLLKATVVLALGLAAAAAARHARASVRHVWIAATLGSLALLPLVAVAMPDVTIQLPERYASLAPAPEPAPAVVTTEARPILLNDGTAGPRCPLCAGPGWAGRRSPSARWRCRSFESAATGSTGCRVRTSSR